MTILKAIKEDRLKTTVVLPRDVWKRAKLRAIDEESDLSALIVKALEAYLKSKAGKER
jgi:hypothetical protein